MKHTNLDQEIEMRERDSDWMGTLSVFVGIALVAYLIAHLVVSFV